MTPRGAAALAAALLAGPASAAESVAFTYDALGRLTQTATTGGVNDELQQTWTLDPAGNRVTLTVAGSANKGRPDAPVIVLPVNGLNVEPIELR